MSQQTNDPLEILIEQALNDSGLVWVRADRHNGLDFYLVDRDIYIEVKAYHSDRIANQMSRAPNVIAAQGLASVKFLCELLRGRD